MDSLTGYDSSASEGEKDTAVVPNAKPKMADRRYLQAAPQPSLLGTLAHRKEQLALVTTTPKPSVGSSGSKINSQSLLMNNPRKSTLLEPVQGPAILNPNGDETTQQKRGEVGKVESNTAFDHTTFEDQRNSFQRSGKANAPDNVGTMVVRTSYGHERRVRGAIVSVPDMAPKEEPKLKRSRKSKPEPLVHDSDDEINYGIWGPPSKELLERQADQVTDLQKAGGLESSLPIEIQNERAAIRERDRERGVAAEQREEQDFDTMLERKMSHLLPPRMDSDQPTDASSTFHPPKEEESNYKGESWITPPSEFRKGAEVGDVDDHVCYVPKKCVARFTGHNKGVQRIRLFPKTGHLLLSAGLDGKCKVWSVAEKKVMRTYIGHTAAVRDVQFNLDGTKFLSCSFDRFIRLWNTASGEVENTFTNRKVPYIVKFYPKDDSIFVAGCSDNRIVAYDTVSGDITQEYNHHLAPVNTITFVEDQGMKMVTSSDDKKVLVWEWDIGVPIKYISDPTMHSMPVMTLHPTGNYIAGQSLDNHIAVYQGRDRFALQRKKKFRGHNVAGYACDITISPDGQFLCSGDGDGKLVFWEWRRHK